MIEELSGVLRSAGKEPVVLGNQALVLPFGCRVVFIEVRDERLGDGPRRKFDPRGKEGVFVN